MKYSQNASFVDKSIGIYKPPLTIYRRYESGQETWSLNIQVSLQKLLNLLELSPQDYLPVLVKLKEILAMMGIDVDSTVLGEQSHCSRLHFCKNLLLDTRLMDMPTFIALLDKLSKGKKYGYDRKEYLNGGVGVQFYSKAQALTFYDKGLDLQQPLTRAYDKERTTKEKEFAELLKSCRDNKFAILRVEYRLQMDQTVRRVVSHYLGVPHKSKMSLKMVFNPDLAKRVLVDQWDKIFLEGNLNMAVLGGMDTTELFNFVKDNSGMEQLGKNLQATAIAKMVAERGIENTRSSLLQVSSEETLHTVFSAAQDCFGKLSTTNPKLQVIKALRADLERFQLIAIPSFVAPSQLTLVS